VPSNVVQVLTVALNTWWVLTGGMLCQAVPGWLPGLWCAALLVDISHCNFMCATLSAWVAFVLSPAYVPLAAAGGG
jgi:hypothetical protein